MPRAFRQCLGEQLLVRPGVHCWIVLAEGGSASSARFVHVGRETCSYACFSSDVMLFGGARASGVTFAGSSVCSATNLMPNSVVHDVRTWFIVVAAHCGLKAWHSRAVRAGSASVDGRASPSESRGLWPATFQVTQGNRRRVADRRTVIHTSPWSATITARPLGRDQPGLGRIFRRTCPCVGNRGILGLGP